MNIKVYKLLIYSEYFRVNHHLNMGDKVGLGYCLVDVNNTCQVIVNQAFVLISILSLGEVSSSPWLGLFSRGE